MNRVEILPVALSRDPAVVSRAAGLLNPDERERAARFRFDEPRASFTVARALLRTLLAQRLGKRPGEVAFVYGPHGKPALEPSQNALCFNLSHSGCMALYGFAWNREIGVDIEQHRSKTDRNAIARRFFHPAECTRILRLPGSQQEQAFFDCWSRKEAYIKATGMGLALPLTGFQVPVESPPAHPLHPWDQDSRHWTLWTPSCSLDGYSYAAVYEGEGAEIEAHDLAPAESLLSY